MVTYIISALLVMGFSAIAMKAVVKNRKHKKKQLDIARSYDKLVRECKLAIDYSEFLCYRYIGLDRKNKKLVLIDHCESNKQELCISLPEISESRILHTKDESQNVKTIFLELRNKRNNQPVRFCFYNKEHDEDIELPSLSKKAIHWKTKVDIHKHPGNISLEAEYVL